MVHASDINDASIAQLVEHALRKRTVVGSIPTGGFFHTLFRFTSSGFGPEGSQKFVIVGAAADILPWSVCPSG